MPSHDAPWKRAITSHSRAVPLTYTMLPLLLLFSGCGVAPDRDLQAFNTCMIRHAQDAPLCEAPRQAYELDLPLIAARSAPGLGIRQ